jgi:hypothetical protein
VNSAAMHNGYADYGDHEMDLFMMGYQTGEFSDDIREYMRVLLVKPRD